MSFSFTLIFPFNLTLTTDIFKVSEAGLVPLRMSLQNPSIPKQNNVTWPNPPIMHTLRIYLIWVICLPKKDIYLDIFYAVLQHILSKHDYVEDQSLNCHISNKKT